MNCFFCNKHVDLDDDKNYREVLSWVSGPKLDSPKLREQTGRVAHKDCIDKILLGQAVDQESLFEEAWPERSTSDEVQYYMVIDKEVKKDG
jgi:hypothetical protein